MSEGKARWARASMRFPAQEPALRTWLLATCPMWSATACQDAGQEEVPWMARTMSARVQAAPTVRPSSPWLSVCTSVTAETSMYTSGSDGSAR